MKFENINFPRRRNITMSLLLSTKYSNLNGDPDCGGAPRMDFATGQGLVTDVCIKRKLRNAINIRQDGVFMEDKEREFNKMYIDNTASLNAKDTDAVEKATGMTLAAFKTAAKKDPSIKRIVIQRLLNDYFDVRFYGAVLTAILSRVTGVVQVCIGETVDPVDLIPLKVVRQAIATDKEVFEDGKETMFGEKTVIAYGLYRVDIVIDAIRAQENGFTAKDVAVLYDGIIHMFDHDRSAARSKVDVRRAIAWERQEDDDDTADWKLWETLKVEAVPDVKEGKRHARCYEDYVVTLDTAAVPSTVYVRELV